MKRTFELSILMATFLLVSACGKTNLKKMSHKWNVASYVEHSTNAVGAQVIETGDKSNYSVNYIDVNNQSNETHGSIDEYTITFSKNGTFNVVKRYHYSKIQAGTTIVTQIENFITGTWVFVGTNKTEDFKKNERILINLTKNITNQTDVKTTASDSTTTEKNTIEDTYLSGEKTFVYVVKESAKHKLVLEVDNEHGSGSSYNGTENPTYVDKSTKTYHLEE